MVHPKDFPPLSSWPTTFWGLQTLDHGEHTAWSSVAVKELPRNGEGSRGASPSNTAGISAFTLAHQVVEKVEERKI